MSVPILSVAEMRAWEETTWAAGIRPADVINRVGELIAERLRSLTSDGDRILLLAGRGNNGADTQATVPHLKDRITDLLPVTDPVQDRAALGAALERHPRWVVDGLFGIGLNRPLDTAWCEFIRTLNGAGRRVLAVDVPSGLNADTGENWGAVVQADVTLTVGAPKRGLLTPSAWNWVGRLEVARDVGLVGTPTGGDGREWVLDSDFADWPPRRPVAFNKGSLGKAVVLAGSVGFSGAAVLATQAAGRARPGLLSALVPLDVHLPVSIQLPSAMVHPFAPQHPVIDQATALLVGPGLAAPDLPPEVHSEVLRLWRDFPGVMVVDASALAWLCTAPDDRHAGVRVLTPHPGEAARLLGSSVAQVQADRPAALQAIARRYQAFVALKGHQTLVGAATGPLRVNSTGNPGLAQGGTGDVLAGLVTGLLAQPMGRSDPVRTLAYAVWEHGQAADRLEARRHNWTAQDLANEIGW